MLRDQRHRTCPTSRSSPTAGPSTPPPPHNRLADDAAKRAPPADLAASSCSPSPAPTSPLPKPAPTPPPPWFMPGHGAAADRTQPAVPGHRRPRTRHWVERPGRLAGRLDLDPNPAAAQVAARAVPMFLPAGAQPLQVAADVTVGRSAVRLCSVRIARPANGRSTCTAAAALAAVVELEAHRPVVEVAAVLDDRSRLARPEPCRSWRSGCGSSNALARGTGRPHDHDQSASSRAPAGRTRRRAATADGACRPAWTQAGVAPGTSATCIRSLARRMTSSTAGHRRRGPRRHPDGHLPGPALRDRRGLSPHADRGPHRPGPPAGRSWSADARRGRRRRWLTLPSRRTKDSDADHHHDKVASQDRRLGPWQRRWHSCRSWPADDTTPGLHVEPIQQQPTHGSGPGGSTSSGGPSCSASTATVKRHYVIHGVWPHDDAIGDRSTRTARASTRSTAYPRSKRSHAVPRRRLAGPAEPTRGPPSRCSSGSADERQRTRRRLGHPRRRRRPRPWPPPTRTRMLDLAQRHEGWLGTDPGRPGHAGTHRRDLRRMQLETAAPSGDDGCRRCCDPSNVRPPRCSSRSSTTRRNCGGSSRAATSVLGGCSCTPSSAATSTRSLQRTVPALRRGRHRQDRRARPSGPRTRPAQRRRAGSC